MSHSDCRLTTTLYFNNTEMLENDFSGFDFANHFTYDFDLKSFGKH